MLWIIILIIIITIIAFYKMFKPEPEIAKKVYKKYNHLAIKYDAIGFPKNKFISPFDILAVICVESGHLTHKDNSEIIGDDGKSFGIMQVSELALIDVNRSLKTNYKKDDLLKSVDINVLVGSHYLELCIEKAIKEKSPDPIFLGYRKYNSGIGRAKDNNLISIDYAIKVSAYKNLLKKLIKEGQL